MAFQGRTGRTGSSQRGYEVVVASLASQVAAVEKDAVAGGKRCFKNGEVSKEYNAQECLVEQVRDMYQMESRWCEAVLVGVDELGTVKGCVSGNCP